MDQGLPDNFVFIPAAGSGPGILHELSPAQDYAPDSFVLIPYAHPLKQEIRPRFFRVVSSRPFLIEKNGQPPATKLQLMGAGRDSYLQHVSELRKEIALGNIYEINYCVEFAAENVNIQVLPVFRELSSLAGAPYAMLVKMGDEYILSASPELFLEKKGRRLITKPIKGTARRDADPETDQRLKDELQGSLKERTENVMAVDVARNDLSQLATKGSVQVNRLYNIESFETVHQMVSTVSCKLKEHTGFDRIIAATFPMASMTGAPKISAMNLIERHEDFNRNYYSGAMGMIDERGDFSLSVNIRCIFYNARTKRLSIAVGGAITYLSEPEKEYEECLLKAKVLLKVLNAVI